MTDGFDGGQDAMDPYLQFLSFVALLYFLPKTLSRFGLPSPVTEIGIGVALGPAGFALATDSELLAVLAGIGISALFLFAGVEVEVPELLARRGTLLQHLSIQLLLFALAGLVGLAAGFSLPVACLAGVAVMSPSAGFIVPALEAFGLPAATASWIKQKAVATELLAIAAVLFLSNSASRKDLLFAGGGVILLGLALPAVFVLFHLIIRPHAPRAELSFVMVVALASAYLTHHLGVHYLVGAFVVGLAARRYLDWGLARGVNLTSVRSALAALRFFSAFFVPFYFFHVGTGLPADTVGRPALVFLILVLGAAVPLRIASVMLHRRLALGERWGEARNVALFLGPTMVFSLAVAEILRDRFAAPGWLYGGLVLYGAATSFLPLFTRKVRSTEYEDVLPETGDDPAGASIPFEGGPAPPGGP